MKVLDYYFIKEYQWLHKWFSNEGQIKAVIRPSSDFISKYGWIDFEILENVFSVNSNMKKKEYVDEIISDIENVFDEKLKKKSIYNEVVELVVEKDFCRIIDNLGDSEGIEAPLSWNISTPEHLQFIPTKEVYSLIKNWHVFLNEIENQSIT